MTEASLVQQADFDACCSIETMEFHVVRRYPETIHLKLEYNAPIVSALAPNQSWRPVIPTIVLDALNVVLLSIPTPVAMLPCCVVATGGSSDECVSCEMLSMKMSAGTSKDMAL